MIMEYLNRFNELQQYLDGGDFTDIKVVVHYKHWTGPVYFNLIRPFHHLVVSRMARAGLG
jgi:hypothetical protein